MASSVLHSQNTVRYQKSLLILCCCIPFSMPGCSKDSHSLPFLQQAPTAQHKFVVQLRPLVDSIRINQLHQWEIRLTSASGTPVQTARIQVHGGMPSHNHGLPTLPKVTRYLGDGRYLLDGVQFSMPGEWEVVVSIEGDEGADTATFTDKIALPGVAAPPDP